MQGDSTGNASDEWVYMLSQWLAARHSTAHVKYKLWDDTAQAYAAWQVIQAGSSGERYASFPANSRSFYTKQANIPAITGDIDVRWRGALDNYARNVTQTLVARYGLPTRWGGPNLPANTTSDTIIAAMAGDKKRQGGRLRFILPCGPGDGQIADDVPLNAVREALAATQ